MNYMVIYNVYGYNDEFVRTFNDLKSCIRFIKYNDQMSFYKVYKIRKDLLDLNI